MSNIGQSTEYEVQLNRENTINNCKRLFVIILLIGLINILEVKDSYGADRFNVYKDKTSAY